MVIMLVKNIKRLKKKNLKLKTKGHLDFWIRIKNAVESSIFYAVLFMKVHKKKLL